MVIVYVIDLFSASSFVDASETFGNLKGHQFASVTHEKCVLPQYPENSSYIVINDKRAGPGDVFDNVSLIQYVDNQYPLLEIVYLVCARGAWSGDIFKRVTQPVLSSAWNHLRDKEGISNTNTSPEYCKLPPYPEHGLYVVAGDASAKPGDERASASLEYACRGGYGLVGAARVRCEGGTWYDDAPECFDSTERPMFGSEAKMPLTTQNETCQLPDQPDHGHYEVSKKGHIGLDNNYTFLELNYTCDFGYGMVGFANVHCSNGKWSHVMPTCIGGCRLDSIPGVSYLCKGWRKTKFSKYCNHIKPYGAEVLPECAGPYYRSNKPLLPMKCVDGNWNYTPACLPECGRRYYEREARYTPEYGLEVGGRPVQSKELPWHVGIYNKNYQPYMQICGGTIISSEVIVTGWYGTVKSMKLCSCEGRYESVQWSKIGTEKKESSWSYEPAHCIIRRQFRAAEFRSDDGAGRQALALHNRMTFVAMFRLVGIVLKYTLTMIRFHSFDDGAAILALELPAHCFWNDREGLEPSSRFAVAAGKLYRPWSAPSDHGAQLRDVENIVIPKRFRGVQTNFQDDLAIVHLSNPLVFNYFFNNVWPACVDFDLNLDRTHLTPGNLGKVPGWGLIDEDGKTSPKLQVVELPYVEIGQCITDASPDFRAYITSDKICAGYTNGTALCKGDSGGGLVFALQEREHERFYLRGVASTAPKNDKECNTHVVPTFTHILAHEHFIKDHLNLNDL
ncbi:Limulus clotting factor C [Eumeta japonica]|uniref:Limulus clotting factor C n=1 Tax=Eumeta variegata TaxID=151549 RepID=A0A4C1UW24_EUMVA|nr:Limulus clotting factor C [Eumeta japonica]